MDRIFITADILCDKCYSIVRDKHLYSINSQLAKEEYKKKWIEDNYQSVKLFSLHYLPNVNILEYFNVITSEVVLGTGPITEFAGAVADLFGTRASGFEEKILTGKKAAMKRIQYLACEIGANAVIGIDIDFNVIGTNMIMIVVIGTPVILEKAEG